MRSAVRRRSFEPRWDPRILRPSVVRLLGLVGLLGLLGLVGCERCGARVRMEPVGDRVKRSIAIWRERRPERSDRVGSEPDLVRRARAFYELPPAIVGDEWRLNGRFGPALPADLGGSGQFVTHVGRFGTVAAYRERVGGSDRPAAVAQHRRWAAGVAIDLMIGWIGWEAAQRGAAEDPAVRAAIEGLDGRGRQDVQDLAATAPQGGPALVEFLSRRGYLPSVAVADPAMTDAQTDLGGFLRMWVNVASGRDRAEAVPPALSFLAGPEAEASWKRFASGAPIAHRVRRDLDARPRPTRGPRAEPSDDRTLPTPWELVAIDVLGYDLLLEQHHATIELVTGAEPVETDGAYDPATRTLTWARAPIPTEYEAGVVHHATWATPDEPAQRAALGAVLFSGADLVAYESNRAALPEPRRQAWDAALDAAFAAPGDRRAHLAALRRPPFDDDDGEHLRDLVVRTYDLHRGKEADRVR